MYYYRVEHDLAASPLPGLLFDEAEPGAPSLFLTERDSGPAVFRATQSHHLTAPAGVRWLTDNAALERPLTATSAIPGGRTPWPFVSQSPEKSGYTCWRWATWAAPCSPP